MHFWNQHKKERKKKKNADPVKKCGVKKTFSFIKTYVVKIILRIISIKYQISNIWFPANIFSFEVNNRSPIKRCEICSKLTIKTLELRHWRRSGVFIVNFEHISHFVLVFLLLIVNKKRLVGFRIKTQNMYLKKLFLFFEKEMWLYDYA